MIVKRVGSELWLTTQPDHARVSGAFAATWGNDLWAPPDPFVPAVQAAIHHDDGWLTYEMAPRLHPETSRPCHFRGSPFGIGQIPDHERTIAWLSGIDPYVGLLVNMHRCGLPRQRYGLIENPPHAARGALPEPEAAFLRIHEALRDERIGAFGADRVWTNYHLLQVWDSLSLYLCEGKPEPARIGPVPQGYGPDVKPSLLLSPLGDRRIRVTPFPFHHSPLVVRVVVRRLPDQAFRSEQSFQEAYFAQPEDIVEYRFE